MPPAAKAKAAPRPAPDPEPQPQPAVDEGPSAGSSTGSSAAEQPAVAWIADPGPEFDAAEAQQDAADRDAERAFTVGPGEGRVLDVEWEVSTVRGLLRAQGSTLHSLIGKGEDDWLYLKHELDAIAPAATRILNRYDSTRIAAASGDELALIAGVAGYTMRSLQVRKRALDLERAAEAEDEGAPAGAPEDFGLGAPVDVRPVAQ